MPQKSSPLMRTWGTRFDTLPSSPPLSPTIRGPAPPGALSNTSEPPIPDPLPKPNDEKMPHDASVFVGSLPSTVDQQELTRLLSEHLSEHTEVKNIKVVRDSKGGVCAFVQCEDAVSAATLIHTLHSNPPKPFLGRNLRYEPARAFRTLLVSYRTPMQHIPVNGGENKSPMAFNSHKMSQYVELNLPSAMRVWKPRNSKFYSLLYNTEAVNAETHLQNEHVTVSDNPSLFLQPVAFDSKTIHTLAAYFGRLESVAPFLLPDRIDNFAKAETRSFVEPWKLYPAPHDSPRSPVMDSGCWEIKWEHRDDCVSALMTLRRVPHLTVTWAHQPPTHGLEQRSRCPSGHFQSSAPPYPLHVQGRPPFTRSRAESFPTPIGLSPLTDHTELSTSARTSCMGGMGSEVKGACDTGDARNDNHPQADACPATRHDWSETEFPPLIIAGRHQQTGECGVWSDKKLLEDELEPSASASTQQGATTGSLPSLVEKISDGEGQDLEVPPTPGLGRSPLTPMTPGSMFPATPTNCEGDAQKFPFKEFDKEGYSGDLTRSERDLDPTTLFVGGLETLGPGAWDEEKVAKFFSRFGGLESVKVVRPQNSHAAFAFVKFNNTQSPARAVLEEHNRIYEGRAMRVQLRDCNPPRGYWRHNRGRGRFQTNFVSQNRLAENSDKVPERLHSPKSHDDQGGSPAIHETRSSPDPVEDVLTGSEPPAYSEQNVSKSAEENDVNVLETRPSSPTPSSAPSDVPQAENYREWYDEPSPALTPPPPSLPSSTAVLPYSMPAGYYGPPQWVHPYAPQLPYQMPYMGYATYRPPSQQVAQTFPRPGPEVNAPATTPWPPMGVYGSYFPYPTSTVRAPNMEAAPSQPVNNRAPLAPTGFIQNEQGTLIAVYQPEALDQYMASANVTSLTVPQHSVPGVPSWPQFPQSHAYHFPGPSMASRSNMPPAPSMAWIPNQGFISQQHSTPHITQSPALSTNAAGYRGGYPDGGGQLSLQFRRQATRREQNNPFNNNGRNNQARPFTNRHLRGNMNHTGYHSHSDAHAGSRAAHLNQNSGEWNQWAVNRRDRDAF